MAGNRVRREREGKEERYRYTIKNQLEQLENENGFRCYTYDRQGNLVSEEGLGGSWSYSYDALNRQSRAVSENGVQTHQYDGENLRYETEENGRVTRFVFDRGELVWESSGDRWRSYQRGHQVVAAQDTDEEMHYYLQDEMGSTVYLLDQEQRIKKSYRYDAFGGVLEETGDAENRITYMGQMYDGVTGQYYLRARFYNPRLGRFLQEDTYRGDGLNLYAYCQNNPVNYYDPSGYMSLCSDAKFAPGNGEMDTDQYVNIASDKRTTHILYGDATGGGHLYPGQPGKSPFPQNWNANKAMHEISDIATDPSLTWIPNRVVGGKQRYEVIGIRDEMKIKVITDGQDIITAFPPRR